MAESEDEGDDRGRGRGSNGRKFGNSGKGPTSAKSTPVSLASANGFVITLEDAHNSSMSADPVSTTKPFNTMTATPALDGDTDAAATPKPTVVVMSAFAVCLLLGSLFGFFYRWQRYRYRLKAQMAAREYAEGKTNMSVRYYQTYVLPNKPGNDRVRKVGGHDVKPSKSTAESGFRILGSGFSLGLLAKNTNDDNHDSGSVVHGLSSSEPSHSWPPMNEERLASSVNLARSDPAPTTNTRKPALTIRTSPAKWTGWLRTPTSPTPKSAGSPDSSISGVLFGNRSPLKRSNSNHSSKSNRSDNSKVSATTSTTSAAIDAKASTTPNSSASTIINDTDAATETKCYIRPEEAMIYTPSPSAVYILGETPVGSGIDDGSYLTMVGHQHVGTLTLGSVMEDPFGLLEADHPAQTFATPAIPPPVMISNHQHSPKDKEIPQQNDGTALGVPGGKENGRVDSWQSIQTTSTELTDASEQSTVPFSTF
ncbi:hypothetical protein HK102_002917 [Quaeritorhiza haematococci]|nr:hypothetical protein HK102_002917 [Quaeritorhiza haematococci]